MKSSLKDFCEIVLSLKAQKVPFVIITLTSIRGSFPQELGAKMLVSDNEILFGTVGGGKIEAHCISYAKNMIKDKAKKSSQTWNLQKDIGMTCGGEASFLFENESIVSHWNIAIFGAGHVAQALVRVLKNLDCNITVIDNRKEWLAQLPVSPNITPLFAMDMCEEVESLNSNHYIVSMTMGHSHDVPILKKALRMDFPFVGVIGSVSKKNTIIKELLVNQVTKDQVERLVCPIGDSIGNNDPSEIAISITSQLLRLRDL